MMITWQTANCRKYSVLLDQWRQKGWNVWTRLWGDIWVRWRKASTHTKLYYLETVSNLHDQLWRKK
jgi:hypothetical protein